MGFNVQLSFTRVAIYQRLQMECTEAEKVCLRLTKTVINMSITWFYFAGSTPKFWNVHLAVSSHFGSFHLA